jgi:hypothetical protein
MSLDNNVEKFFNDVKYQAKLTGEYLIRLGKSFSLEFLRNEYEGMNVKFVDKEYLNKKEDYKTK